MSTLLMRGMLDRHTPMLQTEYYSALKMKGLPVTLLQFEGEYHRTRVEAVEFYPDATLYDELV